jgi:hypothetical protein
MYTSCERCGRRFSEPRSYRRGRRCADRIARAARVLQDAGSPVADRAADALLEGAAVPLGTSRIVAFRIASSDGSRTYICTPQGCNCPHGLQRLQFGLCYHKIVAAVLAA